ncbi:MAG: alpha/beta hydrolase family protein [Myxococcales bacterium]|nr:alpha/beta hydrolase family protein [Myxococcales bacterium]
MGYGIKVDQVIGGLSRVLHLRSAKENTVGDLSPYLDLPAEQMFPEPPPIEEVRVQRSILDRAIRSSTVSWESSHQVLCPRYRRRHEGEYHRNLEGRMRWLRPEGAMRKTCLVYVHGWLEPGSWAEETTLFRKWSKELDVDLVHVALPFHGVRKPRSAIFSGELFWTADLVRTVEGVRQAVHDARAAVAWMRAQGYERVGVTGISLGGAITMLLACLDPLPDFVIPIVAHLQLHDAVERAPILWRMKKDLDGWGIDQPERHALFQRLGLGAVRPKLDPGRQLWVQAREDVYIDAKLAERQWEDWGHPQILWIDGGHMTFPLHMNEITDRIARMLRELPPTGSPVT